MPRTRLPAVGPDPAFSLPVFERATLGNGVQVRAAGHHRAPVLTLLLLLPVGAAADPPDQPGLAALTADLLDEGSAALSDVELHRALMRIGGRLGIEVWSDATVVGLTTLSRHAREGLRLLFEIAARPRFDPADVARVRDLRVNRIRQLRRSAAAVADRVFVEALYRAHPYGHPAIGTEAALRALGPAEVTGFHRRRYLRAPWTLVAAGDLAPEALLAEVARAWGEGAFADGGSPPEGSPPDGPPPDGPPPERSAPDRSPPGVPPPEPPPVTERMVFAEREGAVQSEIRLGHAGAPRTSPDYYALSVLNMVLGGQFVSRVNLNLREDKGYTYGARTSFDWRVGRGPFSLQVGVQTAATLDALREAVREIVEVRGPRPPSPRELETARAALTRGFPRSFETAYQVARAGVRMALHGLPDDHYTRFVPRILAVGADDVLRAAQRHLRPDELLAVVVGSRPDVLGELAGLGFGDPVEWPAG